MKIPSKTLIAAVLISLACAACAYAEETTTEMATAPAVAAEVVSAVPAEKTTIENLQTAFDGESNANARYLAFAQKADEEGYGRVASLFRAAARAEQIHFERHGEIIKNMGGVPAAAIEAPVVKSTAENLQAAIDGETYEYTKMYPEFVAKADLDRNEAALDAFEDAGKAEAVHAALYKQALEELPSWKGATGTFQVCSFCGNVVESITFTTCPICGREKDLYLVVA